MLQLNTDQSKNGLFKAIVYTCAALGGGAAYAFAPAGASLGVIGAYVAGGIAAGGLAGPLALTGVALCGYAAFRAGQALKKVAREEAPVLPLAVAIVGVSSLRAMTVEPIRGIAALFKKSADKNKNSSHLPSSTTKPKDIKP